MIHQKKFLTSTKALTKDLINGYSIVSDAEYFSKEDGSQKYLVYQLVFKYCKPITNDIAC